MYALLLFILFPVLYNKNKTWFFIYGLLFFVVGRFIAYRVGLSYATIIHIVFYLGILIPFMIDKVFRKYYTTVALWLVVYIAYLFLLHVIHGNEFFRDLKDNFRCLFMFIYVLEVYENIKAQKIDTKVFEKVFKVIFLLEIALCWMQYLFHDFGNFFRITEYTWNGEVMSMSGVGTNYEDNNLCFGTLMAVSTFANYLALSIAVLYLARSKAGFKLKDYTLLIIGILTLLITGVRAPFLILLVMLFFILLRGVKTHLKIIYLSAAVAVVLFLLPFMSNIGNSQASIDSFDNPVIRTLNVFSQIEEGSLSEEGTLTLPLSMIPYIIQNPLLGNGLHYGRGYLLLVSLKVLEDQSISDAGVFFYWAEYGFVGILVFFFFYFYVVRISSRFGFERADIRLLVIMMFLLSIVDCSVIDNYCITSFALAPILIKYYHGISSSKVRIEEKKTTQ